MWGFCEYIMCVSGRPEFIVLASVSPTKGFLNKILSERIIGNFVLRNSCYTSKCDEWLHEICICSFLIGSIDRGCYKTVDINLTNKNSQHTFEDKHLWIFKAVIKLFLFSNSDNLLSLKTNHEINIKQTGS